MNDTYDFKTYGTEDRNWLYYFTALFLCVSLNRAGLQYKKEERGGSNDILIVLRAN